MKIIPKVSVCIPSFNHVRFVRDCIDSVQRQTFDDYEIVIQDDCSDDGTWDYLRSLQDSRISLERNERRMGISSNWNLCVRRSRGALIVMLPSDDMLHPDHLQEVVPLMERHQNIGFLGVAVDYIHPQGQHCGERYRRGLSLGEFSMRPGRKRVKDYAFATKVTFSGTIFRKETYDLVGGFNEGMVICEDWEFWVKCLFVSDEGFLNKKLVFFRWHANNTSGKKEYSHLHYLEAAKIIELIGRNAQAFIDKVTVMIAQIYLVYRICRNRSLSKENRRIVLETIFERVR